MTRSILSSLIAVVLLFSATTANAAPAAEKDPGRCKKPPPGRRVVKPPSGPEVTLADLLAWLSAITCKPFLLAGPISAHTKVSLVAPASLTGDEAYQLALGALDTVGLTVEKAGTFMRVVETADVESTDVKPAAEGSTDVPPETRLSTRVVHVEHPRELAQVLGRLKSEHGKIDVIESAGALVITDLPENINRMLRVLRERD
jgi:type II secretory pathway component GspD/PulD (secretin)